MSVLKPIVRNRKRCGRSFGFEGLQPVPCGVVDISDSGATFCPLLRAFLILFCQLVLPNSVDMFSRFTSMLHHAVEAVSIFLGLAVHGSPCYLVDPVKSTRPSLSPARARLFFPVHAFG